jgi:16S rRNA (cytidine1402-2'-O)-methyltransferase
VASGLGSDAPYRFLGYLPRRKAELDALWADLDAWPTTIVAFESPQRLPASLASLAAAAPERRIAVCRELTKRFEEVVRGSAVELAARFAQPPKGEITLVLAHGRMAQAEGLGEAVRAVRELVALGVPRRRATEIIAPLAGVARNELYRRSL